MWSTSDFGVILYIYFMQQITSRRVVNDGFSRFFESLFYYNIFYITKSMNSKPEVLTELMKLSKHYEWLNYLEDSFQA